jgi:hypothetical protein
LTCDELGLGGSFKCSERLSRGKAFFFRCSEGCRVCLPLRNFFGRELFLL